MIKTDSPISVRHQLRDLLVKEIEKRNYLPGQRFPSERELAAKYGISRASVRETVAQLLAQGVLVRSNGRGTFVSERAPEPVLAGRVSGTVGFWISEQVFHFVQAGYNQILSGVTEVCHASGRQLRFLPLRDGLLPADLPPNARPDSLEGSIIVGGISRAAIEELEKRSAPLITVDLLNSNRSNSVSLDYGTGTRLAVEALYKLGHRKIGFIGFPNSSKYVAYWHSLRAHGIEYRPEFVEFLNIAETMSSLLAGYTAMRNLIAAGALPTALLITNDYAALGAMDALAIANIRVPGEVSIIGYDDLGQTPTPLSTIRGDLVEVGRIAARQLLDAIETGERPEAHAMVPVELILRSTSGPPPRSDC